MLFDTYHTWICWSEYVRVKSYLLFFQCSIVFYEFHCFSYISNSKWWNIRKHWTAQLFSAIHSRNLKLWLLFNLVKLFKFAQNVHEIVELPHSTVEHVSSAIRIWYWITQSIINESMLMYISFIFLFLIWMYLFVHDFIKWHSTLLS